MDHESRLVRDLLDANLRLTGQFIELARLAIGAPTVENRAVNTYVEDAPSIPVLPPEFAFSSSDDWADIPDVLPEEEPSRPKGS